MKIFKFAKLKKFSSYFIELVIVVLGVSIAFQLNVWNDQRKTKKIEQQLIENFAAENAYNLDESDSSLIDKRTSIRTALNLIELLQNDLLKDDTLKLYLARLYEISWPNYTTTHLENYLNFTTGSTPVREEMLNLNTLVSTIHVLGENYAEQKQLKYFDYLSDAIDMTNNLTIVNRQKVKSVEFRNNLMFIVAYEQSMAQVLDEIEQSQFRLDSLINMKN